ncbi:HDOD domain-containing protein [Methylophaga sp. OBS4]|uniref:HDOD domain-containing protein n=1 Tax=Methylophaga sp. OBS4 TaxID=2991935 RepID=UPI0022585A85|nr:HDOD domain-containing protein [Methylophaga sp. OBS4]MCX4187509.1 HDOD domain-containing protein [Methylophaga sp. OBS4]
MLANMEAGAQQIIQEFRIPPKPAILIALQQELAKDDADPVDFADVIARDVALSAVVLKTVNSPLFGLSRELSDIRQAVILLGGDKLKHVVTFFTLRQSLSGRAAISLEKFWDNAMEVANISGIVARHLASQITCQADMLYAFGLFRDCGIPLMAMKYADYKTVLFEANHAPHHVFTDIEDDHYQTNHAVVGYFVASSWNLPKSLCELVLRHHDPEFMQDTQVSHSQKDLYALIKIASDVLTQYKYGKLDSEWPMVEDSVLAHFQLSELDHCDLLADIKDEYDSQFGAL